MYFSIILMMSQKDPMSQLMNMAALWTLNNFDNFFYLLLDMVLMKNQNHRKILKSDNYMMFKVSENEIDATVYWIYIQIGILFGYYAFDFWNKTEVCNDLENYLVDPASWHPPAKNQAG